jgi:hypothetical protein
MNERIQELAVEAVEALIDPFYKQEMAKML